MLVSFNLLGVNCLYNLVYQFTPIRGEIWINASRIQDISCDDTSASRYGEPLIKTKPVVLRFLHTFQKILVYDITSNAIFMFFILNDKSF